MARMRAGLPVIIDGDGEQTRDLLYVSDAVDAIQAAGRLGVAGAFNIGTGSAVTINAVFTELARLTGYVRPPEFGPARIGDIRHSTLDSTLAWKRLRWRARTSLASGLASTLAAGAVAHGSSIAPT